MKKLYIILSVIIFLVVLFESLKAFDDGITGVTRKGGQSEGCSCHNSEPSPNVNVLIISPSVVRPNDTVNCFLKISGGPHIAGGCDIAVGIGSLILSTADTSLKRLMTSPGNYELTHRYPKFPSGDTITFAFKYIAPNITGIDTIFANGNSVNHDTTPSGDQWNFAVNKLITVSNTVGISANTTLPKSFNLEQNYPNPFNPATNIRYSISTASFVTLKVYDILGREIAALVNNFQSAGTYTVPFSISRFSNNHTTTGVYFYTLETENFKSTKKMLVIK
jgi:hypothetical protein